MQSSSGKRCGSMLVVFVHHQIKSNICDTKLNSPMDWPSELQPQPELLLCLLLL
jgi:hypothetical protein